MTKEEIYDDASLRLAEMWRPGEPEQKQVAMEMMDQYAKQEAIGFAEWAGQNGWYLNKIGVWSNRNDNTPGLIEALAASKTTEQLYEIYLSTHQSLQWN